MSHGKKKTRAKPKKARSYRPSNDVRLEPESPEDEQQRRINTARNAAAVLYAALTGKRPNQNRWRRR